MESSGSAAAARVGVLFVHGIGEQRRGETLVRCAEPIIHWLLRAVTRKGLPGGGPVRVDRVDVAEARVDGTPAHLRLTIESGAMPLVGRDVELLCAEAWWASSFAAARFTPLVKWAVAVAPRIVEAYALRRVKPLLRTAAKMVEHLPEPERPEGQPRGLPHPVFGDRPWIFVAGLLAIFLVAVTIPVLSGVVMGALIPLAFLVLLVAGLVPRFRRNALRLQLRIANSVGDSYVLITSPVRFGAMIAAVKNSLEWLEQQGCSRVAVVAHSQGAVVAHRAVLEAPNSNVSCLITYGSGLSKLTQTRRWLEREGRLLVAGGLGVVGASGYLTLLATRLTPSEVIGGTTTLILLGLASCALALGVVVGHLPPDSLTGDDLALDVFDARARFEWHDYYTDADPVPDGALPTGERAWFISTEIENARSLTADHSSYWRNEEQFVAPVVATLLELANASAATRDAESYRSRISAAGVARSNRLWLMSILRGFNAFALLCLVVALGFHRLHEVSAWLLGIASVHGRARGAAGITVCLLIVATGGWLRFVTQPVWLAWMRRAGRRAADATVSGWSDRALGAVAASLAVVVPALAAAATFADASGTVAMIVGGSLAVGAVLAVTWAAAMSSEPQAADTTDESTAG